MLKSIRSHWIDHESVPGLDLVRIRNGCNRTRVELSDLCSYQYLPLDCTVAVFLYYWPSKYSETVNSVRKMAHLELEVVPNIARHGHYPPTHNDKLEQTPNTIYNTQMTR